MINLAPGTSTDDSHRTASRRVHEAEIALHDARGTGVDAWIAAAADRLHEALRHYIGRPGIPAADAVDFRS